MAVDSDPLSTGLIHRRLSQSDHTAFRSGLTHCLDGRTFFCDNSLGMPLMCSGILLPLIVGFNLLYSHGTDLVLRDARRGVQRGVGQEIGGVVL